MNPQKSEHIIFTFLSKVQEQSVHQGQIRNNLTSKNKSVTQRRKMATTEHQCYSSIGTKIEKLIEQMNNKRPTLWGEEDKP